MLAVVRVPRSSVLLYAMGYGLWPMALSGMGMTHVTINARGDHCCFFLVFKIRKSFVAELKIVTLELALELEFQT